MSRTVTALFASRDEAEAARARLAASVKVESARVVAQDTAGALVGLPIEPTELNELRAALARGDHLVVAAVARGADPERIVSALSKVTAGKQQDDGPKLSYSIGPAAGQKAPRHDAPPVAPERAVAEEPAAETRQARVAPPKPSPKSDAPVIAHEATDSPPTADDRVTKVEQPSSVQSQRAEPAKLADDRPPVVPEREEVRIGEQQVARGGGRLMNFDAQSGFESRAPARRLTDEEIQAGGLLKERVIEVIEMREEAVISREVVVREEVLIRKSVNQRTETFSDTVRRTDVEVEELEPRH